MDYLKAKRGGRGRRGVGGGARGGPEGNLYNLRNRLSSATYVPPPVKMVEILKPAGTGVRGANRREQDRADRGGQTRGAAGQAKTCE
jgi:hypothetical protein